MSVIELTHDNFDKVMNFESYTGKRYKSLKFVAILDGLTAVQLGFDAPAEHQQHIGSVPPGIPNDWKAYKYAKFMDVENNPIYLGIPWIVPSSVKEVDNSPYIFTVRGIDDTTAQSIRSMLIANGVEHFEITRM